MPRLLEALHTADAESTARIIDVLGDIGPAAAPALTELAAAITPTGAPAPRGVVKAVTML